MKICAGLGSLEDYGPYIEAGADELFCGCMPFEWLEKYGVISPLNRREVLLYRTQIASMTDMKILSRMAEADRVPVSVTINSLTYIPEQYPLILNMIRKLRDMGFERFIIADPYLMTMMPKDCGINVSGEFGEFSRASADFLRTVSPRRIIFHRKVTPREMAGFIAALPGIEYEAFALNERCYYTGAMCNSLHADELPHICRIPYVLGGVARDTGLVEPRDLSCSNDGPGAGGCGICALPELRIAGITHLKLVGRGNRPEKMVRDIAFLKRAAEYEGSGIIDEMFPDGCPEACYY